MIQPSSPRLTSKPIWMHPLISFLLSVNCVGPSISKKKTKVCIMYVVVHSNYCYLSSSNCFFLSVHEQILFVAGDVAQEKNSCSLVLKLKVFISKYLQEHYRLCITRAALFLKSVPGTFFNATTSSESNCDRDCRGHPSGLTVDYSTPLHFTRNLTLEIGL